MAGAKRWSLLYAVRQYTRLLHGNSSPIPGLDEGRHTTCAPHFAVNARSIGPSQLAISRLNRSQVASQACRFVVPPRLGALRPADSERNTTCSIMQLWGIGRTCMQSELLEGAAPFAPIRLLVGLRQATTACLLIGQDFGSGDFLGCCRPLDQGCRWRKGRQLRLGQFRRIFCV